MKHVLLTTTALLIAVPMAAADAPADTATLQPATVEAPTVESPEVSERSPKSSLCAERVSLTGLAKRSSGKTHLVVDLGHR